MTYNYEVYDWNGEQDRLTYSAECDTLEQCYDELMLECRIYGIKWTGDINRNRKALEKAINQRIIIRECPFRGFVC